MDGLTDQPTDRPSYRDAFLTDASENFSPMLCENGAVWRGSGWRKLTEESARPFKWQFAASRLAQFAFSYIVNVVKYARSSTRLSTLEKSEADKKDESEIG